MPHQTKAGCRSVRFIFHSANFTKSCSGMYLEQVKLDGFKSYAEPVTVSAFDPQFNAITGLNGM